MNNHIYIDGFGLAGYRSFSNEVQRIAPCQQINLLVGQNNSGKSNILLFLNKDYSKILELAKNINSFLFKNRNNVINFNLLDYHIKDDSDSEYDIVVEIAINKDKLTIYFEHILEAIKKNNLVSEDDITSINSLKTLYEIFINLEVFTPTIDHLWLFYKALSFMNEAKNKIENYLYYSSDLDNLSIDIGDFDENQYSKIKDILHNLIVLQNNQESQKIQDFVDARKQLPKTDETRYPLMLLLIPFLLSFLTIPKITLIPAIRKIGEAGSEFQDDDFSGQGIIDRLAQLQNPSYSQQTLKDKFEQINQFLRTVTGNENATLEIPYERDMINVHIDNKTLPLSSLGTGIHEVIILAAAATILENQVLCIEEPELHLHPILQKKLIRYLQEKTTNQYFITTHSAHFLDTPDVAIFHITLENGQSKIECVSSNSKKYQICADLGYRPSDLLQANCIIWVEGPSDRIYLNHWLKLVDPNLVEGIHYSIMFYGGKLLSHLSASDTDENDSDIDNNEQIQDFISLRSLNHHIAMIIDSDKEHENTIIRSTKQRLQKELEENNGFVWITEGREIENYISPEILENAIAEIHPQWKTTYTRKADKYNNSLILVPNDSQKKPKTVNKVKIAKSVVETQTKEDLSRLDLQDRLNELVSFINKANGIQPY